MWRALLVIACACNAQLGHALPDASSRGAGDFDAAIPSGSDASSDAAPDATPVASCNNGRVVYLDFDGVTLARAGTSDATQNHASWIGVTTADVPPYRQSDANRATEIQNITSGVRAALSQFPITVVTTRPAAGPYILIAFGGSKTTVGTVYSYATSYHDCGDLVKSDVGWVSDNTPDSIVANVAVGTIGWSLGLQGTTDTTDCMCGWASSCQISSTTCTLGTAETTGTSLSPASTCGGLNPQNEVTAFHAAFCE